jgi:hypothetical protein
VGRDCVGADGVTARLQFTQPLSFVRCAQGRAPQRSRVSGHTVGMATKTPYMYSPAKEDMTMVASPTGRGTSTLVQPYPRPKLQGLAGVTSRPSAQWITYGNSPSPNRKKLFNKRAAQLRLRLRQIMRVWHTYVESTRIFRQKAITDVLVGREREQPAVCVRPRHRCRGVCRRRLPL